MRGGGAGVNLHWVVEEAMEEVKFVEVYFRKKVVKAKRSSRSADTYLAHFISNKNRDIIMDRDPVKESRNTPEEPFPFQLEDNEAVLSYISNGETYFIVLTDIEEKPLLAYPQGNRKIEH